MASDHSRSLRLRRSFCSKSVNIFPRSAPDKHVCSQPKPTDIVVNNTSDIYRSKYSWIDSQVVLFQSHKLVLVLNRVLTHSLTHTHTSLQFTLKHVLLAFFVTSLTPVNLVFTNLSAQAICHSCK